jgi:hypothetical protein
MAGGAAAEAVERLAQWTEGVHHAHATVALDLFLSSDSLS